MLHEFCLVNSLSFSAWDICPCDSVQCFQSFTLCLIHCCAHCFPWLHCLRYGIFGGSHWRAGQSPHGQGEWTGSGHHLFLEAASWAIMFFLLDLTSSSWDSFTLFYLHVLCIDCYNFSLIPFCKSASVYFSCFFTYAKFHLLLNFMTLFLISTVCIVGFFFLPCSL